MSIALVGLVLLQFYWIRNVHQLHIERFKTEVDEAVETAVKDIEDFERNLLYTAVHKNNQISTIGKNGLSLGNLVPKSQSVSVQDTVIRKNECHLNYLVISGVTIDSASGVSAEHRVVTRNYEDPINYEVGKSTNNPNDSSFTFPIKEKGAYKNGIMVRSKYLNEMMLKMFTTNVFDDITMRLSPVTLDTLISNRLKRNKVDTLFNFRIKSQEGEVINFEDAPKNYQKKMEAPEFSYKLYPSDVLSSQYYVELDFPNKRSYMFKQMIGTLVAALLLVLIIIFAFYFAVSTIFKQKKVSEIKNDFISNMTHELKTPISTISLACEAITDPVIQKDPSSLVTFIGMISSENKRLGILVEKVLQTSLLEKGKLNLQRTTYAIHDLVKDAVQSFEIQFQQRGGELQLKRLDDVNWSVDKLHFSNVLFNLMDNALKYSTDNPITKVELINESNGFSVVICDNGIGIKKEDQKRIFDKLYRVSTGDVHDVKGFGLGLDYVNRVVDMHGGKICVKSEMGKGSTFKITFKDE